MSNMMGGPLGTHSFETLPSGRQNTRATSLGNQHNNPIIPGTNSYGTRRTLGFPNQETSGPEVEHLIQEAYQRTAHGEAGGRLGYGI